MNQTEHTPTPWTAVLLDEESDEWMVPEPLVIATSDGDMLNGANAAYIVECVNAHEKLTTDRDALLTAWKEYRAVPSGGHWMNLLAAFDQSERGAK